jgi:two-component system, cell cycle sensor histidine kinase and response regulator CckA
MSPQPVPGKSECQDVLPHSEERWQALFENCSIGIATADAAGRCVAMNSSFRKLLGLAKEDLPAACKLFTESIEESSVNARVEKYCLRKDSSPIWLNVTVSLIPGTERMPQFLIALVEEITERKRAEEALRQSEECFRLLVEGVQEYAIYMLDPGGLVRTWNAGAERIKGYKADSAASMREAILQQVNRSKR